jgi:hypothetical protein
MYLIKIDSMIINNRESSLVPPWRTSIFFIDTSLVYYSKKETLNTIYKNIFYEILDASPFNSQMYTDASKTNSGVGITIIYNYLPTTYRLLEQNIIYTAESS